MKKLITITLMGILLSSTLLSAVDIKVSGEMWNRWTLNRGQAASGAGTILRNNLSLERGYIGLEPKFSETVKGRFTIDIFSTDALKDGAGLKLKYAYVDFSRLIPVPDMTATLGLQKVYFGSIYDWDYTLIGKAPSDEYKFANSADYGVTLHGYIPGGWGEYALGAYNGEGYKNYGANLKDNIEPAWLANLRLTPVAGVTLGGSVMLNSSERSDSLGGLGGDNPKYNSQMLYDGFLRLAFGPVNIGAEYLNKSVSYPHDPGNDHVANCVSVFPVVKLKSLIGQDIDLVGRYDRWDATDNTSDENILTSVTGGINYNFMHDDSDNPALQLQLNYSNNSNSVSTGSDSDTVMLQLKWRFAATIL